MSAGGNSPQNIETSLLQATQLIGTGRFDDAEDLCEKVLEAQPNNAAALHTLGLTHYMVRRYGKAIEHISKAVQFDDSNPQYFCNLAESYRRAQKPDLAIEMFEKSLALKPEYLLAQLGMANVLRDMGRRPEAMARYRLALALNPTFAEAYHYLGAMYLEQDRKEDAIAVLRKAVALKPNYMEARLSLAAALDNDGMIDEAKEVYEQIIEENPKVTAAHNNLANLLKTQGDMDAAISHYEKALEANPKNVQAHYNLSRARPAKSNDKEIAPMEALLKQSDMTDRDRSNVHFALGKIFDDLERYPEAFEHYKLGNEQDDRARAYDPKIHNVLIKRLKAVFTKQLFMRRQGLGSESDTPIFIVGMPRSGTTLTEQILASHPDVFGAGELDQVNRLVNAISAEVSGSPAYPESAGELDAVTACRLGESYVSYVKRLSGGSPYVTDKMPGNFMHLDFISLLMPNARIIHCRRNPMDSCLSCYFQHFTSPMPFSNSLESLGHYYQAYEEIMAHWHEVLPQTILDIPYEETVSDHEEMCRRLVEFCGLEWDDACLQFHKTKRPVKTASTWQVRQPLYTTSVQRWLHYEKELAPLIKSLGKFYIPPDSAVGKAAKIAKKAVSKVKKKKK